MITILLHRRPRPSFWLLAVLFFARVAGGQAELIEQSQQRQALKPVHQ